jgi:hypothetical protein
VPDKSIYQRAKEIIEYIRSKSPTYQQLVDRLTQEGMDKEDAEKLIDVLTKPIEDEEDE